MINQEENEEISNAFVREASVEDLDDIFEIEERSSTLAWSKDQIAHDLNNDNRRVYVCYIEVLDSAECGCGECGPVDKEEENINSQIIAAYVVLNTTIKDQIEILNLVVDVDFQGLGIGEMVMNFVISSYKEIRILLEVRKSNTQAINLYKKLGFINNGIRPNYYPNLNIDENQEPSCKNGREDALLFERSPRENI